jgi:integrase
LKGKKNVRIERRTLADGTVKTYEYERKKRQPKSSRTVAGIIAEWQNSPEWDALRPNTQDGYVRYINPLFQAFKAIDFRKLKREHLMSIRNVVAKKQGHGAAIAFCRSVSALYKWAIEQGKTEFSPATKMRNKLRMGELPAWRNEQAMKAMRELPEPYRRAVVLAYYTGQRRGDLCSLKWSAYDGVVLTVKQQKAKDDKDPLQIPVVPALRAELEAWKQEARAVTILETVRGMPWIPAYLSRTLPIELEKVGLPRLGIHGLRKLTAARLAEAGCSPHEIAAITGHETLSMITHYTKSVNQRTLADVAVLRLGTKPKRAKEAKS